MGHPAPWARWGGKTMPAHPVLIRSGLPKRHSSVTGLPEAQLPEHWRGRRRGLQTQLAQAPGGPAAGPQELLLGTEGSQSARGCTQTQS